MRTIINNILFVTLCILMSGCSTIYTQTANLDCYNKCMHISQIYSGTSSELCELMSNTSNPLGYEIIDLPLSFVFDTVILPYTIYKQNTEGSLCNQNRERADFAVDISCNLTYSHYSQVINQTCSSKTSKNSANVN